MLRHENGDVYIRFDLPTEPDLSVTTWAEKLSEELGSDATVRCSNLEADYGVKGLTEGVIIDTSLTDNREPYIRVAAAVNFIDIQTHLSKY